MEKGEQTMPYIGVHLSVTATEAQKDALKARLGQNITIIPGKVEDFLMIDISDGHTMYFAGEKRPLAYLDVKCYGTTEFSYKKAFTEAAFAAVRETMGLQDGDIYLTYGEYSNWGTKGTMK